MGGKDKYKTLEHNGPCFPQEYEPKGFQFQDEVLSPLAEEMLWAMASHFRTDKWSNKTFTKNFYKDLKPNLTQKQQQVSFDSSLYWELLVKMEEQKEQEKADKKVYNKDHSALIKEQKEKQKDDFGFALIDGVKSPITTYCVESPRIFVSRNKHPHMGRWIKRVTAEDITINCSSNPPSPPKGHKWGAIEQNTSTVMTYYYEVPVINVRKFGMISQTSEYGAGKNEAKFDQAKKLVENWSKVEKYINDNLKNTNEAIRQAAMISYIVKETGIRIGDDTKATSKDYDNNIVGASTLRKKNVFLTQTQSSTRIDLSFIGKDSVPFKGSFEISQDAYKVLSDLYFGKKDDDFIFDKANNQSVNDFLGECLPGLTARNFRTAYASALLAEALRDLKITKGEAKASVKCKLDEVQLIIAKKLNHQRNIGKNQKESLNKAMDKFADQRKELEAKFEELTKKWKAEENKEKKAKLNERKNKLKERLELLKMKKDLKKNTAGSAINTSKTNYSDCRILISFCKENDLDLSVVYPKTMQAKFEWALETSKDFYKNYPSIT